MKAIRFAGILFFLQVNLFLPVILGAQSFDDPIFHHDPTEPELLKLTTRANRNVAKYWNYRNRLRRYFVNLSTEAGGCIPMEEFFEWPGDPAIFAEGQIRIAHWGDGTIKLGWYIGVLATELHMLTRPKQYPYFGYLRDVENNLKELYCALTALYRLDEFGEQRMWETHPVKTNNILLSSWLPRWPSTPGFFIRDDVNRATMRNILYNGSTPLFAGGFSDNFRVIDFLPGTPIDPNTDPMFQPPPQVPTGVFQRTDNQMSQDQAIHLLMGLALVRKLVPANAWVNGISLREFARSQARSIVKYMRGGHQKPDLATGWPSLDSLAGAGNDWKIRDPVSPKTSCWPEGKALCIEYFDIVRTLKEKDYAMVARGGQAYAYAEGLNLAGKYITGHEEPVPLQWKGLWWGQLVPLLSKGTITGFEATRVLLRTMNISVDARTSDNLHMAMALLAVGNSLEPGASAGVPAMGQTLTALYGLAEAHKFHIYPMVHIVLHPSEINKAHPLNVQKKPTLEEMLGDAPYGGPQDPVQRADSGWGSENRFIKGRELHGGNPKDEWHTGLWQTRRFHGLDYMLLHNLHYILHHKKEWDGVYQDPLYGSGGQIVFDRKLDISGATTSSFSTQMTTGTSNGSNGNTDNQTTTFDTSSDYIVPRGVVPNMGKPNWFAPPFTMPPIGYAVTHLPRVDNSCTANASVTVPITVEYDDFYGNRDTVRIVANHGALGYVTLAGEKNKFDYHGLFWGRWQWNDSLNFALVDEDGNRFELPISITYPGAEITPPEMGHQLKGWNFVTTLYLPFQGYKIPAAGYADFDFTVYAQDRNCVPWKPAPWFITAVEGVIPMQIDQHTLRVRIYWTLLTLHGQGKVTLASVSGAGGPLRFYDIPLEW